MVFFLESWKVVDKELVIKIRILYFILLVFASSAVSAGEMRAIAHQSVTKTAMSKLELRRIFSRKQALWADGQQVIVFVLPSKHKLHQRFSKEVLKIFPYQLDRIWNKLTYSGIGTGPIVVDTYEELLKAVSATPGAIGYGEDVVKGGNIHVISVKE